MKRIASEHAYPEAATSPLRNPRSVSIPYCTVYGMVGHGSKNRKKSTSIQHATKTLFRIFPPIRPLWKVVEAARDRRDGREPLAIETLRTIGPRQRTLRWKNGLGWQVYNAKVTIGLWGSLVLFFEHTGYARWIRWTILPRERA